MAARASRPWKSATAIALAIHGAFVAFAILSVKIIGPPPEARALDVRLVQLQPRPLRREQPPTAKLTPSSAPASVTPSSAAPPAPAPSVVMPQAAPGPTQPSPSDEEAGRVRAMLRGSTGCDSAALLELSGEEQQKCARWRVAHIDPNLRIPAPIDPVKRSWYEASMRYRRTSRWFPTGPSGIVRVPKGVLPPGHTLMHLGPFSVGLPSGAFNDDNAPPP